jgi:hypothetical protein
MNGQGNSRWTRLVKALRTGLFGTLTIISKKVDSRAWRVYANMFLIFLQMSSFCFTTEPIASMFKPTITPVRALASIISISHWAPWIGSAATVAVWYFSIVWVLVFLLLLAWSMYSFIHNDFVVLFPLRILRVMGQLSSGFFFIPLVASLMSIFSCSSTDPNNVNAWLALGYVCNSATVLSMQIISALLTISMWMYV